MHNKKQVIILIGICITIITACATPVNHPSTQKEDKSPYACNWTTLTTEDGLIGNYIASIAFTDDGIIWIGTWGNGASRFDGTTWINFTKQDGLRNEYVPAIAVQPNGMVWFGTEAGISGYDWNSQAWTHKGQRSPVQDIAIAPDSTVAFATWLNGVTHFEGQSWVESETAVLLTSIAFAADGSFWGGNYDKGVTHYANDGQKRYTSADGLPHNDVFAIAIAPDQAVWVGTAGGAAKFDGQQWITFHEDDGLIYQAVSSIAFAPDGAVWFGGSRGVSRYDGTQWTTWHIKTGAYDSFPPITIDADGTAWFGTSNGLMRCTAVTR